MIQGSSVGGSVNVISTNPSNYEGVVRVSIPGCGVFLEQKFEKCPASNPPQIVGYSAIGYDGGTYSFSVPSAHGNTYSWSFSGLPTGAIVHGATTSTVRIFIPDRTSSDPTGGRIIMNVTINTPCGAKGASKQITYGVVPPPSGGGGGGGPLHPDPVLP